jgi:hypothetical protein
VNVTSVAQAVWSYTPRSLTDIQSLVSAIQNNNPNLLSTLSDILYVPAPYYAGQVSATQVAAFLDNLVLNYGLAGPVAAVIAASPYGLWSTNFVAQVLPYLSATTIAQVLYSGQMDANHAQLILYWFAQNYYYNKWVYTITANATSSITFSTNVRLSTNVLIAQNITIASGVTVTCGTTTCFFVAQAFNNQGKITAVGATGGPSPTAAVGNGGTGGGGVVVIAVTAALGTINVAGSPGGNASGSGNSTADNTGVGGVFFIPTGVAVPSGGTGAAGTSAAAGAGSPNAGGGGGEYSAYPGAAGGSATVKSFSSPNAMVTYILQGLSDWWLINVLGKALSSTTPLAYMYGSGGGSGSGDGSNGGGGGGGGEVVVYGYDVVSGSINAVGGTGGNGTYGGGGGGGGLVFVFYGATSGSVTANVAGGIGQGGGATGAPGTAYIAQVTVNG